MKAHPLVVTGMHRSGTSFVASLFAGWNLRMGDRLLPADEGNPAGYFEDLDFLTLNRRILLGGTPAEDGHRDWGWTESETLAAQPSAAHREEATALVAARAQAGRPWGFKDPRTSMLLDFWDEVLGAEARFLFVYRPPWDVADSMLRTGAEVWLTHPEYPARIWVRYNRRILDFHRRHPDRSVLVGAHRLLREPEAFVELVRRRFGVAADAPTVVRRFSPEAFLSVPNRDARPRLWRHANPEAVAVLGELDDAADLGDERRWEALAKAPFASPRAPRLSVVIPCRDDGDYLLDAVASVERNAPEAEVVVVDDGSTAPRTRHVLAALRSAGHRVVEQPPSGLPAARNAGISASAGEYVLPLDADNRLLPGFAAEAVARLDSQPDAGVVYGDRREFGARRGDVAVPELDLPRMLWSNYIDACAVFRRSVWTAVGGYDLAFPDWEDWDFWLGALERGFGFVRLPKPTFEYRVRPDSLHQRFLRRGDYRDALRRLYQKHHRLVATHSAELALAAHVERRALFADAEALRASRDVIQAEIDRLAESAREHQDALQAVVDARDLELASVKFVLDARDAELGALRGVGSTRGAALPPGSEPPLTAATHVFTIVARNYLAQARVLAESLRRHNPLVRLQVVVLDDPEARLPDDPSFDIVRVRDLPFDPPADLWTMAAIYDVTELSTAVKPWAFEHLFARGADVVVYLDPDIEVFDSLGPLEPLARAHGLLLTPHATQPLPRDGRRPGERELLRAGLYNLGFIALSAEAGRAFLPWWRERLRRECLNDPADGLFVDQRWIDLAPAIFTPGILKDPGYNVAYWNLPHREITREGGRLRVDGRPLRFFHFSGFSPQTPQLLSKHQHVSPRVRLSERPVLNDLCQAYATALQAAGHSEFAALPYGFAATAGGLPLDAWARRVLRRTYLEDEARGSGRSFPNPFSPAGAADVVERLQRPSPHSPEVPGYLGEIWSDRADLRVAFPHIDAGDADRFLDWVRTQGVREHEIPPVLVPAPPAPLDPPGPPSGPLAPGVNVYGYAFAESGTGQILRAVVAALAVEGIPYAVVPFRRTVSRQERRFDDFGAGPPAFDTNLICVNADQVPLFFESMRGRLLPGARNIGLWAWEVEDLPPAMAASETYLDEVWGISAFTASALARRLTKPVRAFPLPVAVPEVRHRTRAELGMPEGFLFLFCFDYLSVFDRKNPMAVVEAFGKAFGNRPDVVLFIKTMNDEHRGADAEALRLAARGHANVFVRDGYVASDQYFSMLDACDCYVSLHRAEGFGLTVAEAMALGKPVIATAYSATLEFAGESNSYPVPARMIEVGDAAAPYPSRSRWADPDVAAAAEQMARVFTDRQAAAEVGARARADMDALHGPAARGTLLRRLLNEGRRVPAPPVPAAPSPPPPQAPPPDSFEAQALAAESLLGSPRADLPSPLRYVAVPLRRLVLRCLRIYWVQQLAIDRALLRAMRTLRRQQGEAAAQAAAIREQETAGERMAAETARLREEVVSLTAEVRALQERPGGGRDVPRAEDDAEAPSGAGAASWPGGRRTR